MSPLRQRQIREIALGFIYALFGALVFMLFFRGRPQLDRGDIYTSFAVAALITAGMSAMVAVVVPYTRRATLLLAILARAIGYSAVILLALIGGVLIGNVLDDGPGKGWSNLLSIMGSHELREAVVFSVVAILVYSFFAGISQKMGPGVLVSWMLGRYHRPKEVQRIFMFLDLRNSTALAEQLGDLRFSAFIQEFFASISTPLLDHRGEVSHFIGDEAVLCWRVENGLRNANCLRCFYAIQDEVDRRSAQFAHRFGVVPSFKAGMHVGTVIATEVGQVKSEVVYHGDVLNVASRLQKLCGEERSDLLLSSELASMLGSPAGLDFVPLGPRALKGRSKPLEVISCQRIPLAAR